MNLQELTGYESGLTIFKGSDEAIITNWSNIEGIPRVFVTGMIGLNDGDDLQRSNNVDEYIIDYAIRLAKEEDDEDPKIDGIWENDDCYVIVFEGWN
jgi:hypothetical protein